MAFYYAGRMMVVLAAAIAVVCVVGMVLLQTLVIDFAAVIVYFLGRAVSQGSRRAAKWSLMFMVVYVAMALSFIVGIEVAPERLRTGGRSVEPVYFPWIQGASAVLGVWTAVCAVLLIRGLWQTRSKTVASAN